MEGKFRLISENGIIIFGEKLFPVEIVQEQTLEESSWQIYRFRKENQETSSGKFKTQENFFSYPKRYISLRGIISLSKFYLSEIREL